MNRTVVIAFCAEFGPLLAFFIAGRITTFFDAVAVLMCTTTFAVILSWTLDKRIPFLPILGACFVLIGGGITLYFKEPDAIIFCDTLYYLSIALLLGVTLHSKKYLFEMLFGTIFSLSEDGWKHICIRWFWFLLLAALANEVARHLLTPERWIEYRFYKSIVVTCFALYQLRLTRKYRLVEQTNSLGIRRHTKHSIDQTSAHIV
jgi:intracellular septation protein